MYFFVEKVCSVLQTTKSAFRYTCTLESPVPPPNCNITYDELEICAPFSASNLDFYFIKDPGTELCDTYFSDRSKCSWKTVIRIYITQCFYLGLFHNFIQHRQYSYTR